MWTCDRQWRWFHLLPRLLSTGNFNSDGFDVLSVGIPGKNLIDIMDGGAVSILYSVSHGLHAVSYKQLLTQRFSGIHDLAENSDIFGFTLPPVKFTNGEFIDLVIVVSFEDVGIKTGAGGVHIMNGSNQSLVDDNNQFGTQNSSGQRLATGLAALLPPPLYPTEDPSTSFVCHTSGNSSLTRAIKMRLPRIGLSQTSPPTSQEGKMKIKLILHCLIAVLILCSRPLFAADKVVVVPLNSNKAAGVSGEVQYNDNGRLAGAANMRFVDGWLGIGTSNPKRALHVRDYLPVQFESLGHHNSAVLDFNHSHIETGYFSRLNWRSDNSLDKNLQFAAIDVFFEDKINGSEDAAMRFLTITNGTMREAMRIRDGRVGIGTENPSFDLDVQAGFQYQTAARIANSYDGPNTTVLRLRVGPDIPTSSNNYIEFRAGFGAGNPVGAIEGNGTGGVTYKTSGADIAEYLPLAQNDEPIEPGDIVGLTGGFISREIGHAAQVRVVSSAPGVLGNFPGTEQEHRYRKIAFLGQVPVQVRGPVHPGDFILPSGRNDGTGIAVSPAQLCPEQYGRVVGVAWQEKESNDIAMINTVVGSEPVIRLMAKQSSKRQQQLEGLLQEVRALRARLERLEGLAVEADVKAIPVAMPVSGHETIKSCFRVRHAAIKTKSQ